MADHVQLTLQQQEAIAELERNLQIIACAGSGKTEVISRRIANILQKKENVQPENVVAFTFTEKAAESLKYRIESALGMQVPGMYIGTIHGFCKHLLSNTPSALQISRSWIQLRTTCLSAVMLTNVV